MQQLEAVALFTEFRNATHHINFVAPFEGCVNPFDRLQVSGDQAQGLSGGALTRLLEEAAASHPLDAIVLSRYVAPHLDAIAAFARARSVPLCFHLDDWLFELPTDLGEKYAARYDHHFVEQLDAAIHQADRVLCSTPALARRVSARFPGKAVGIVQGVCYNPYPGKRLAAKARISRLGKRISNRHAVTIGYAGSSSHARDLQLVLPAIEALMDQHPEVHFSTFGMPLPAGLQQRWPGRVFSYGYTTDYDTYLQALYELGWDIGLAPLVDDGFNGCKTPTKLLEYAACGIPVLCSDVEPYRDILSPHAANCCIQPGDWAQVLADWVSNLQLRRQGLSALRRQVSSLSPAAARQRLQYALGSQAYGQG